MDENNFDTALESLDKIEELLGYMWQLALRAASDDCGDAERTALQRDFNDLRRQIDKKAELYQNAAVSAAVEQLSQTMQNMETPEVDLPEGKTGV